MMLTRGLLFYWLDFTVLEGAMKAAAKEKSSVQYTSYTAVNLVLYSVDQSEETHECNSVTALWYRVVRDGHECNNFTELWYRVTRNA